MKKTILLAAFAVFGFTQTNAQVSFGAKAGANFASLNGDGAEGLDGLTSFHVGAVAKIGISEFFSVQPELVYSAQGASSEVLGVEIDTKLDYLNIPIMADFAIAEGLSLQGGPQFGVNISAKASSGDNDVDIENIETLDIGVGIGAQYKLPSNGLFFQVRYVAGLTEIQTNADATNGVASVSVGYMFN